MKYCLLIASIVFIQGAIAAQCKFSVDEVDEFTKSRVVVTTTDRVGIFTLGQPQLYMSLGRFENGPVTSYGVWIKLDLLKRNTCFSSASTKLLFLDSSGDVHEMAFSGDITCATKHSGTSDKYYVSGFFNSSASQLTQLSQLTIEKVRVITSDASFDIALRTNNDGYGIYWFKHTLPCVLK
jgi:hypothetical protein